MYVTDGECVTYRFEFDGDTNASAILVLDSGPRVPASCRSGARGEARRTDLKLCGVRGSRPARVRRAGHQLVAATLPGIALRIVGGILAAIVITVFALRLLGIRRGWVSALVSGVLGWGVTIIVALGLNHWDWGADGLTLHLLAIGIPDDDDHRRRVRPARPSGFAGHR